MLTMDLSTGGNHELCAQIRWFEPNQATFANHQDATLVATRSAFSVINMVPWLMLISVGLRV